VSQGGRGGEGALPVAPDGSFVLGEHTESDRRGPRRTTFVVAVEGCDDVAVRVGDGDDDAPFLAVAYPRAWMEGFLLLPDGSRAGDAGARFSAVCWARRNRPGDGRSPPVHVSASLEGYHNLAFELLLEAPPAPLVLQPR